MVAFAVGVGVLALGTGVAGPAVADNGWAAAAGSPSTGVGAFGWGPVGQKAAEAKAIHACAGAQGNPKDCVIIASSPQCVAIAETPSNDLAYAGGSGATAEAASKAAVAALKAKGFGDAALPQGNTACSTDPVPS